MATDKELHLNIEIKKVTSVFNSLNKIHCIISIITNKRTIIYHKNIYHNCLSLYNQYCYMFRHFHVNIREFQICALLS